MYWDGTSTRRSPKRGNNVIAPSTPLPPSTSRGEVQLNDFPQSIIIVLQQSAHILETTRPSSPPAQPPQSPPHSYSVYHQFNPPHPHETHRKFFSPSLVIAEGQTLHSLLGFVRHATEGTPPIRQLGTLGGGGDVRGYLKFLFRA